MKGVVTTTISSVNISNGDLENGFVEQFTEGEVETFKEGIVVEILKVIKDSVWASGTGYVIFDPQENIATAIDSDFVTITEDDNLEAYNAHYSAPGASGNIVVIVKDESEVSEAVAKKLGEAPHSVKVSYSRKVSLSTVNVRDLTALELKMIMKN